MRLHNKLIFGFVYLLISATTILAQDGTAIITGKVTDEKLQPLSATVAQLGSGNSEFADQYGNYTIKIPANTPVTIVYFLGSYKSDTLFVNLKSGMKKEYNPRLKQLSGNIAMVDVTGKKEANDFMKPLDVRLTDKISGPGGGVERLVIMSGGAFTTNETSSQYNVRGGNFDENLIYVDEVEIYRPLLVRSGQQEGLSFINPELTENISFSAGGFNARYGDKLSSVLDVKYKKPRAFHGSVNASFLGGGIHFEGLSKNKRITYLFGARHKTNQYLLRSLDTQGEYRPTASDVQTKLTFDLDSAQRNTITLLGNFSETNYRVIPTDRETDFGTVNEALRFKVFFEGQESNKFVNGTGAFIYEHRFDSSLNIKLIGSYFETRETESYDILGQYFLDQLENDFGSSDFGDSAFNRGIGSFLNHARNKLKAKVYNSELKTRYIGSRTTFFGGLRFQTEQITDQLREWYYIDSAGYSIPNPNDEIILLNDVVRAANTLSSYRVMGYADASTYLDTNQLLRINYGIRANYWSISKQTAISPRVSLSYFPKKYEKRLLLKFAAGYYYQPPFYREMRDYQGNLNLNIRAQKSFQLLAGAEQSFLWQGRQFKFVTEAYYKSLSNIIPFKTEDVRLRYFPNDQSKGYTYGIDFRLNGEFVEGTESWFTINYMKSIEDIADDFYYDYYNASGEKIIRGYTFDNVATDSVRINPGNLARPTDQRVTASILFSDYIPKFPKYKVYLNLLFGSGMPFGPPGNNRYTDRLRYPFYRRVDIGFSRVLIDPDEPHNYRLKLANRISALSVSLEVFNLLQVNNTISYLWITDVTGRQYAIPNYLTNRQINLRLIGRF
ncbi:MAG: TonB-dependent receptor plug domain-containing protein [Bacteroidetes bacterium]|nr:TonB-dependent receptor plug domain-containing protein [Bacteroidota bacterium]